MSLQVEIDARRKQIHTDSYPMSIGEIANLYLDGDLEIHPEFQRFYRWTETQKSRLIESILLGIPLPPIFVSQRDDGVWEVVDGLQRLSTIFSFMGILKDEYNKLLSPLKLVKTKYLPSLENIYWDEDFKNIQHNFELLPNTNFLTKDLQRTFKREKIDIKIIKKESDLNTKYELFHRLNTYGSALSDQEVRNCLMLMLNKTATEWFNELSKNKNFLNTTPITDRQYNEKYDQELVLRFLILKDLPDISYTEIRDVSDFLTDKMIEKILVPENSYEFKKNKEIFEQVFEILNLSLGEDAFRKYQDDRYKGPFSLSLFEFLSTGLAKNIDSYNSQNSQDLEKIREISKSLAQDKTINKYSSSGTRANIRLPHLLPLAEAYFKK